MTLGGIAAAIGLVIDDAIVVVEAIHTKMATGMRVASRPCTRPSAEIFLPLIGSTLTPVVVFMPLAFLEGVPGVFFRALAVTMTVSLLTSLVLAISLTPSLAAWIIRVGRTRTTGTRLNRAASSCAAVARGVRGGRASGDSAPVRDAWLLRAARRSRGIDLYGRLESELLPDAGRARDSCWITWSTRRAPAWRRAIGRSTEIEKVLKATPEVESYSRRTGVALGLELTEPNAGDFLVKLRPNAKHSTEEVMSRAARASSSMSSRRSTSDIPRHARRPDRRSR